MIQKILRSIILVLSYLLITLLDVVMLLAMYSLVYGLIIATGNPDSFARMAGFVAGFIGFAHLKFRHKVREFQHPTTILDHSICDCTCACECKCDTDCDCNNDHGADCDLNKMDKSQ